MKTGKVFLLFIAVFLISFSSVKAGVLEDFSSPEKDKFVHFTAGVAISHASYPVFKKYVRNKKNAWIYSFSLTVLASAAKELYDLDSTGFNAEDILAGTLGGLTVIVVVF